MTNEKRTRGRPKGSFGSAGATSIQSLDRAFDILDALAGHRGLTLTELAQTTGLSPSTAYRMLATLEKRGLVETDQAAQTWHVGAQLFRLGSAFLRREGIVERSRPVMRQLMEATGETANLGIAREDEVLFVSQVETPETIRAFFPPGTRSPMHASGIGKAILSCYSEDRLTQYFRKNVLTGFTDKTITDEGAMRADLVRIKTRGFAYDDEEKTQGMRCIAAPIFDHIGEVQAGISVSGPTHRMSADKIDQIGRLIAKAARELSHSLGAA
jgi:IclR family acetate operon transcriptional repressor